MKFEHLLIKFNDIFTKLYNNFTKNRLEHGVMPCYIGHVDAAKHDIKNEQILIK